MGTACWFLSEIIMHGKLPYWTSLLGWSLVFTNMGALALMNLSGLFMERGVKHEWGGVLSAMLLSIVLVPFQAYAALKGLLEDKEGGWFRTPKSGKITEFFDRLDLGGKLRWLLPRQRGRRHRGRVSKATDVGGFSWLTRRRSRLAQTLLVLMLAPTIALGLATTTVEAGTIGTRTYYLWAQPTLSETSGSGAGSTIVFPDATHYIWYTGTFGAGETIDTTGSWEIYLWLRRAASAAEKVSALIKITDGTGSTTYLTSTTVQWTAPEPKAEVYGTVTFPEVDPNYDMNGKRIQIEIWQSLKTGATLYYDGDAASGANSRTIVPERALALLAIAPLVPGLVKRYRRWRREGAEEPGQEV